MLIETAGVEERAVEGYVSVEHVNRYFVAAGISESALDYTLASLMKASLLQPYDASKDSVETSERIAITHSGRIHYEMSTVDPYFISDMAFATPLRTMKVVDTLRNLREAKMTAQTWREAQREFFKYMMEQDALFFHFPKDGIYDNQL
jgi:hypothetical protein